MSYDLYEHLAWLPQPPADFRERCKQLESVASPGNAIARLAAHALSESQLRQLAAAIRSLRKSGRSLAPLRPFTLGVVGNATLDYVVTLIEASAARHGIALECVTGDFGQVAQEALSSGSRINLAKPGAVLIALDARGLPFSIGADEAAAKAGIEASLALTESVRAAFRKNANATCIVQTVPPPAESLFGNFDARFLPSARATCLAYNAALANALGNSSDVLLDVAALAETVGLAAWHSSKQWNVGKLSFDARFLPLYAEHVARVVGALCGKSRRCLVLDLDNTVWGGVVGDDGIDGIVLGQGDPTGEAFLDVQRAALALRDRGIVLAVSSKNDDELAREPFRRHAEMLLREEHVAVFQANWEDKATNLAAIATALHLGVDALVLLDDNPAERELVRSTLPQVAVPELPQDPSLYARYLSAAGYFESVTFLAEDRDRAAAYAADAKRAEIGESIADIDAYLASLQMTIGFKPFDAAGRARIAQLINKSNQYNLTTRRYGEPEVEAFEADPDAFTLQVRLKDRFGDNGMISVIICRNESDRQWEIDTWLMSCRVLGRRVEHMVLREILDQARARGIEGVIGVYLPTERNALVRDHYERLGFTLVERDDDGSSTWFIDTSAQVDGAPMEIERPV